MKATLLLVLIMLAFLVVSVALAVWVWGSLGGTHIGGHGWAALMLGTVISLGVGGALMALVFISARRGYDDDAS